jgi:hypothetical protein
MENRNVVFEILLNIPGAKFPCGTNSTFASVCKDEYFWKKYLQKYTDIDFKFRNFTYLQTGKIVFRFINELFRITADPNLLISTWALRNFMNFCNQRTEDMDTLLRTILEGLEQFMSTDFKIVDMALFEIMLIEFTTFNEVLTLNCEIKHPKLEIIPASKYLTEFVIQAIQLKMKYLNAKKEIIYIQMNLDDPFVILQKLTSQIIPNSYSPAQIEQLIGVLNDLNRSFQ